MSFISFFKVATSQTTLPGQNPELELFTMHDSGNAAHFKSYKKNLSVFFVSPVL